MFAKWNPVLDQNVYSLSKQVEILFYNELKDVLKITLNDQSENKNRIIMQCNIEMMREKPSQTLIHQALIVALQATQKLSENKGNVSFVLQVQKGTSEIEKIYDKCLSNHVISSDSYNRSSKEIMGSYRCWSDVAVTSSESDLIPS